MKTIDVERIALFTTTPRQISLKGSETVVQPFAELRIYKDGETNKPIGIRPVTLLGLRDNNSGNEIVGTTPPEIDPLTLFRSFNMISKMGKIDEPYLTLRDAYAAAERVTGPQVEPYKTEFRERPSFRRGNYWLGCRGRVQEIMGRAAWRQSLESFPDNLEEVVATLKKHDFQMDTGSLAWEIARGKIPTNPLYEEVIKESRAREEQFLKEQEQFGLLP